MWTIEYKTAPSFIRPIGAEDVPFYNDQFWAWLQNQSPAPTALSLGRKQLRSFIWKTVQALLLIPWIERCLNLGLWRSKTRKTNVVVEPRFTTGMGICFNNYEQCSKIVIYSDGRLEDDISTILHELAHADVDWREKPWHGMLWRTTYCRAARELTDIHIDLDIGKHLNDNGSLQDLYVTYGVEEWLGR